MSARGGSASGGKIAVIKTGGKQYKVKEGQVLKIEKLGVKDGENVYPVKSGQKAGAEQFHRVKFDTLLIADEDGAKFNIGKPSLGEKVEGKVLESGKGKKVSVIKFKSKVRYKKNVGHRQPFTKVEIVSIS